MKRRMFVASLALPVVAIVMLSGFASAAEFVPFQGVLEGTVTRSDPPPPIQARVTGKGTATQLGLFAVDIPHTVTPPNASGFYNFVSANGDTLNAQFDGVSTPTDPGFLYIVERATITGGTGRFTGASGTFVVERLYNINAGTTVGSFAGTISSPGAGQP
jgi:hypothetical protein